MFTSLIKGLAVLGLFPKNYYVLGASGVAVDVTAASTAEIVLATIAIPAGLMGANGVLRITSQWSNTNNANVKTPRIRLGGTGIDGTVFQSSTTPSIAIYRAQAIIQARNSQALQIGHQAAAGGGHWGASSAAVTTGAVNMAVAQNIYITGQKATGSDTLTLESWMVELINPPS